uniref:Uncharacterized protein n=1 Tax=Triticum urartu TaxID=4572 RepID=A0A8R7UKR6_TRIUA
MAHALLMPARATVVRRRCSSMSVGAGAARPRLADTYTSHRSLPRVLLHARARQRSSPRVLALACAHRRRSPSPAGEAF